MYIIKRMGFSYQQCVRFASVLKRVSAELDDEVIKCIENVNYKARKHPGIMVQGPFALPQEVKCKVNRLLKESANKQIIRESEKFQKYILSRELPIEKKKLFKLRASVTAEVENSMGVDIDNLSEVDLKKYTEIKNIRVNKILKQKIYNWQPLDFTPYSGLLYAASRSAAEYAALSKVFAELSKRSLIKPKTIFDFGSGVGSVIWAAHSTWRKSISEYYCVESSSHMIELSEKIISAYEGVNLRNRIFYRQFLPASNDVTSDIVVSAYSLLELPSSSSRLEVIKNLWKRTNNFLVLIELGNLAGFKVINEARDFILSLESKNGKGSSVLFSPCPHDLVCPRVSTKNICYFEVPYCRFPKTPEKLMKEFFTYAVFRKNGTDGKEDNWPRIVQPVLNRSRHVICRLCTSSGGLNEVIVSPSKNGKVMYKCAVACKWGDLLPCRIKDEPSTANKKDGEEPLVIDTSEETPKNNVISCGNDGKLYSAVNPVCDEEPNGSAELSRNCSENSKSV